MYKSYEYKFNTLNTFFNTLIEDKSILMSNMLFLLFI